MRGDGYGDHLNDPELWNALRGEESGLKGDENGKEPTRFGGAIRDDEGDAARSKRVLAAVRVLKGRIALCALASETSQLAA